MSFQTRRIGEENAPRRSFPWRMIGSFAVIAVSPLTAMVHKWKEKRAKQEQHEKRILFLKRTLTVLLSVLLSLLLLAGVAKALISLNVLNLRSVLGLVAADLPTDQNGFTNFLLLGKGDDNHEGIDLTDTIMVVSVDPKTKSAVMISIPRDLYVTSDIMGTGRINALYRDYKAKLRHSGMTKEEASQASLKELLKDVGEKLDLPLHYAAMVNFSGFTQAVDALGGIDVVVPEDLVDREYPGPNWTYETFEITAGPHLLDGETALKYARSRHSTNDFSRSARQQQIVQALGEKAKTLGIAKSPRKILSLLQILSQNVETTLSGKELLGAAKLGEQLDRSRVVSVQLNDQSGLYTSFAEAGGFLYTPPREQFGGASVLLPIKPAGGGSWDEIRAFVRLLTQNRTLFIAHPRIAVLNAGGKNGLASLLATELLRYGFDVQKVENASDGQEGRLKQDTSLVASLTEEDKPLASFFATLLRLPVEPAPMVVPPDQQEQVTIFLGKTFNFSPFLKLLSSHASSSSSH